MTKKRNRQISRVGVKEVWDGIDGEAWRGLVELKSDMGWK